jgi:Photoprotection regulator fluorescence recovery protein
MPSPSTMQDRSPYQNQLNWSKSERLIARRAFYAALKRELHEIIEQTKQKASQIREPADVWELERYLTRRRKDIDQKYQFRNSRLKDVLGRLLYENRLLEEDLQRLSKDKVEKIRSFAQFLAEEVA